ncbi:MAG TPA: S8 family serine peptidase [Mycobacteriales bacterium]|nr:S8 family serine peptidase [Mycobacteriales bacterium]
MSALVGALFAPWATGTASAAPSDPMASAVKTASAQDVAASMRGAQIGSPIWKQNTTRSSTEPGQADPAALPKRGQVALMLELDTQSTGAAFADNAASGHSTASAAARGQLTRVKAMQRSVESAVPSVAPKTHVLYTSHSVLPGVAVQTDVRNVNALEHIQGVKAVHVIVPKKLANAGAIPLMGGPQAWQSFGDTGKGVTIGVIDTGIDYTHADFGGVGTAAAYQAALATDTQPTDQIGPGKKIAGGIDLVGDDYNADPSDPAFQPVPHPDPNPLDCNSHGTHVSGSAAGLGVNADGTTFTGPYNASTPISGMRIGPGVAPEATLVAIRVFGCAGSTNVVGEAVDFAADPNGDGDTSDHLDVINLSLGSDFGSPEDSDSIAMNNAAELGIVPVVASGNAGDLYNTGGSPGNAVRAVGVAATDDGFAVVDGLKVDSPAAIAGNQPGELSVAYDYVNKPGITNAPLAVKLSAGNEDGCDALSPEDAAKVAGKVAFLEWTDVDSTRRCGSAARSLNVKVAGAIGFVFADDEDTFAAGITGDPDIPGMLITKTAGDAIRPLLGSGVNVTITNELHNAIKLINPGNADTIAGFSSRGIHGDGNLKPDVAAPGLLVFSASMGTGNQGQTDSGTSMATPMTAGTAALIRARHPDWTAEEVKADLINTADADVFTGQNHTGDIQAPNRVGAGRVHIPPALATDALAMVVDDPGAVSVSFGPVAVTRPMTLTKRVRVVNTGDHTATYHIAYQPVTEVPGVSYVTDRSSVTVRPHRSRTFRVQLRVDNPDLLTKTIDPTMQTVQSGVPRQFLADASGRIVLTPTDSSQPALRVPVYSAPRPASTMTQSSSVRVSGNGTATGLLRLRGRGVDQGPAGASHVTSLVSGYELLGTSGKVPQCTGTTVEGCVLFNDERSVDLKNVGAASDAPAWTALGQSGVDNGTLYFAVNTWGAWRSPVTPNEFDVDIDTNGDGVTDAILFSARIPSSDVFVTALVDPLGNPLGVGGQQAIAPVNLAFGDLDTDVFDSDVLIMPVQIAALPGITASTSRIQFGVQAFDFYHNQPVDTIGVNPVTGALSNPMTMDVLRPGIMVGDGSQLFQDQPGTNLVVREDTGTFPADHARGVLIVHQHNVNGERAQTVRIRTSHSHHH